MKHLITVAVAFAAAAAYVAYKNRKTIEIEIQAEQPAKPEEAPVAEEPPSRKRMRRPKSPRRRKLSRKKSLPRRRRGRKLRRRSLPRTLGTRATIRPLSKRTAEPITKNDKNLIITQTG